jgi:diguanylate cyclase (GGDEF)-like protein
MDSSRLKGIVETYRDVTSQIAIYETRLLIAGSLISLALVLTILTAFVYSYQYRKRTSILARAQREKEQEVMRKDLRRNREVRLLSQLSEWMQASKSMDELFEMASSILQKLLPDAAGSIYVYSNSRDVLEGMVSWNGAEHQSEMMADECWGLRRGRVYIHGLDEIDFACSHDHHSHDQVYVCIPIVAHGDTIGLLHLELGILAQDEKLVDKAVKLAQTCAEQLSLAIANVRLRDELRNQSIRDPLTGLFNRRHFFETCRNQVGRSRRRNQTFSIASFDVDHFKLFNDNHGHDAGDMVLRAVGECLLEEYDGNDIAFRIGGEEFTILLDHVTQDEAFDRIEKLRKKIEDVVLHYGDKALPNITISAGVAMFPSDGEMPQELMKAADQALYRAKSAGRNQVMLVSAPDDTGTDIEWQSGGPDNDDSTSEEKAGADIKALQEALVKATG